jgi:hypothetical protein
VAPVTLTASVVDATTGQPVAAAGATLTIYTQSGTTPVAGPLANNGSGVFYYVPTVAPPVTYRLVANAPGYNSAVQYYTITAAQVKADGSGLASTQISLASTASAAVAPSATASGTASGTGATAGAITATTPTVGGVPGSATVSIPANTVITTASGAALTGTVTLAVSYSNNQNANSLAAFPSGFQTVVSGSPATLVVGGGVTCTATDASGDVAANFNPAIQVTLSIPAGTPNASNAYAPVKAGDMIPIWYFDANGILSPLLSGGNPVSATLGAEAGGYFPATFSTTHFSSFFGAWVASTTQTIQLTIEGAAGNPLQGNGLLSGGGWITPLFNLPSGAPDPSVVTLNDVPVGPTATASITMGGITDSYTLNGTAAQTINVGPQVASGTFPALTSCMITVNAVCDSGGISAMPSAVVVVSPLPPAGPLAATGITNASGVVTFPGLAVGTAYTFTAFSPANPELAPQSGTLTLAASGNTVTLSFPVTCNGTGITGAGN